VNYRNREIEETGAKSKRSLNNKNKIGRLWTTTETYC